MATKKDLLEAQGYSKRRLLTAFVSGAPGGRELEPTKPLRGVVAGIALTTLLVVGGLAFGYLKPALKEGWNHNTLITTDAGARYVALDGVLYPVLNTTSARLLVPFGSFTVLQVSEDKIADSPLGLPMGITGAPDALPQPARLLAADWVACTADGGPVKTVLSHQPEVRAIAAQAQAQAAAQAQALAGTAAADAAPAFGLLVTTAGEQYLVTGGRRHLVPAQDSAAVLRAVGQDTVSPWEVSARWLNLFPPGTDLGPLDLPEATTAVPAGIVAPPGAVVGSVLLVDAGDGTRERFVIDAAGQVARLSEIANQLYRLGSGQLVGPDIEVTAAQIRGMQSATEPLVPQDWPTVAPGPLPAGQVACAHLGTAAGPETPTPVQLTASPDVVLPAAGDLVAVEPTGGALVRGSAGPGLSGGVHLIDQTGTAFPVPDTSAEMLGRLGYEATNITVVPQQWLALFPAGPALTESAARQPPVVVAAP